MEKVIEPLPRHHIFRPDCRKMRGGEIVLGEFSPYRIVIGAKLGFQRRLTFNRGHDRQTLECRHGKAIVVSAHVRGTVGIIGILCGS